MSSFRRKTDKLAVTPFKCCRIICATFTIICLLEGFVVGRWIFIFFNSSLAVSNNFTIPFHLTALYSPHFPAEGTPLIYLCRRPSAIWTLSTEIEWMDAAISRWLLKIAATFLVGLIMMWDSTCVSTIFYELPRNKIWYFIEDFGTFSHFDVKDTFLPFPLDKLQIGLMICQFPERCFRAFHHLILQKIQPLSPLSK